MLGEPYDFRLICLFIFGGKVFLLQLLINRTPTPLLDNKSPYELLTGTCPSYDEIRTFGCLCFAHNSKSKNDKFVSKSRKCLFMGYPFGKKGWKFFDLDAREFFDSRDFKFFEDIFPFLHPDKANITPHTIVPICNEIHDEFTLSLTQTLLLRPKFLLILP